MNSDLSHKRVVKMVLAIALTVFTFVAGRIVTPLAINMGWDDEIVRVSTRAAVGLISIAVLGGRNWLRFNVKAIRDTWDFMWPFTRINLIMGGVLLLLSVVFALLGDGFAPNILSNILYVTLLCILVGINEEAMFRGLAYGGLIAGLGAKKGGVLWAAIISSLAFGFIHVAFDLDFSFLPGIITGLLKTLESGMFGFVLCYSVLEDKNYWGAMLIHGLFDWTLLVLSAITGSPAGSDTYVSTSMTDAIPACVIFGILIILYFRRTKEAYQKLAAYDAPQYGPFLKEE